MHKKQREIARIRSNLRKVSMLRTLSMKALGFFSEAVGFLQQKIDFVGFHENL